MSKWTTESVVDALLVLQETDGPVSPVEALALLLTFVYSVAEGSLVAEEPTRAMAMLILKRCRTDPGLEQALNNVADAHASTDVRSVVGDPTIRERR